MKKGFVLISVLMVSAIISGIVMTMQYIAAQEIQIAANTRRHTQADFAAISGMNHFKALAQSYDTLVRLSEGRDSFTVIPHEQMTDILSYTVTVSFCCNNNGRLPSGSFFVKSTGWYKRNTRVESISTFQSLFSLD